MAKLDLKRELKHLYSPSARRVEEVTVPAFDFLMVDGQGDPKTSPRYREAVEALFRVSYAARFRLKQRGALDYVVMPLEGLWWADDMSAFHGGDRRSWKWTMMVMQPSAVTHDDIAQSIASIRAERSLPGLDALRLESFAEGRAAQMLHVGPFSEEGSTIGRIHEHVLSKGRLRGKHHEIYLSDMRRAAPANWKTIIRQPMA